MNLKIQRPHLQLPFKPRVLVVPVAVVLFMLVAWMLWPSSDKPKADLFPGMPPAQQILCGGEAEWQCRRFRAPGPDDLWLEFVGPVWLEESFPLTDGRWST